MTLWIGGIAVGLALAGVNVTATVRLWRSSQYERGQKVAQTALTWMLPGFALAVTYMLGHDRARSVASDSTTSEPEVNPWIMSGPSDPPSGGGGGWSHH
jgi:hypothetical protein